MRNKDGMDSGTGDTSTRAQDASIETAIADYREQLAREADVGRATLDELEDHMRLLVDELRESGMPVALAVTEAAKRLGDPRELAREHARVRTPFGAKLPQWRALAVIALVLPQVIYGLTRESWIGIGEGALGIVLCGALVWRSAWARAAMFGIMAWSNVWTIVTLSIAGAAPHLWMIGAQLAALALLAPWRRADLTAPGWALALLYPAYCAGAWMLLWQVTGNGHTLPLPDARLALGGIVLAGAGIVLRARWAAVAASGAAIVLMFWLRLVAEITYRVENAAEIRALTLVTAGFGVAAAIAVAAIAWFTSRSKLGSLRGLAA